MKRVMPLVELRFSMMHVVAAEAGTQDPERFRAFRDEGCIAALDGNFEVLKSPIGDDTFCRAFCSRVAAKQGKVLEFLSGLGDPQVTSFFGKMVHQWQSFELFGAHDTTRVHSDCCL